MRSDIYRAGLAIAALYRGDDTDEADLAAILLAEQWSLTRQKLTQAPAPRAPARSRIR